jgi:zinc/manganese transport system ATP-binding protein
VTTGIALHDVTVAYRQHPAVHHLSGTFAPGSLTAIVGPNGAGKSTLLCAMVGRLPLTTGHIVWTPHSETGAGTAALGRIAYLPQQSEIDRSFPIQVMDVVMLGHWARLGAWRGITTDMRHQAQHALSAVGLTGFEARAISELSVGQFQRVLFARVLLQDAPVILLDEPFNAIDARTTADLMAVIQRWHDERRTVVAVLHDIEQVKANFPQTLLLAREAVAWGPTHEALSPHNQLRARQMAEHWDEQAPRCDVSGKVAGKVSNEANA